MVNFYDILGVKSTATPSDIKSAFRALAKIFHPDKNPTGQEEFKKILRAYETLINPSRKNSYDLKLNYHKTNSGNVKHSPKKNQHSKAQEQKRQQYYDDHIKKHEKIKKTKAAHAELKTNYNEYKYILFATPLAVALFLLIINLAATTEPKDIEIHPTQLNGSAKRDLKTGDSPYSGYFGNEHFNAQENKKLTIKNNSGADVIICLFNEMGFIRSCFIQNDNSAEINQLPKKDISIRYSSGKNWDFDFEIKEIKLLGAFTKDLRFYKTKTNKKLGTINQITLVSGLNNGYEDVNATSFFEKD